MRVASSRHPRPTAGSRFRRRPSGRSSRPQPLSSAKPGAAILSLAFSPDGKQLACGGESGVITLCNVVTGKAQAKLEGHSSSILQLAYSRDGQHLASLGSDRTLRLWDTKQQKESQTFDTGVGEAMAVSPAGRWIAVAGDDNSVRIWDIENPKDFSVLGHGVNVTHLVFMPRVRGSQLRTAIEQSGFGTSTSQSRPSPTQLQGHWRRLRPSQRPNNLSVLSTVAGLSQASKPASVSITG